MAGRLILLWLLFWVPQGVGAQAFFGNDSELFIVAGLAVIAFVVVGLVLWLRRRASAVENPPLKDEMPDFPFIEEAPDHKPKPKFTKVVKHDDPDVTPSLMMVDVYLGYHQYREAGSMLQRMIDGDPNRLSLKVKMLEIYSVARDRENFSEYLDKIHGELERGSAALWDRVVTMGIEIVPQHRLFAKEETVVAAKKAQEDTEKTVDFQHVEVDPDLDIEQLGGDGLSFNGPPSTAGIELTEGGAAFGGFNKGDSSRSPGSDTGLPPEAHEREFALEPLDSDTHPENPEKH